MLAEEIRSILEGAVSNG